MQTKFTQLKSTDVIWFVNFKWVHVEFQESLRGGLYFSKMKSLSGSLFSVMLAFLCWEVGQLVSLPWWRWKRQYPLTWAVLFFQTWPIECGRRFVVWLLRFDYRRWYSSGHTPLRSQSYHVKILAILKTPWKDSQRDTERCLRSPIFSRPCSILPSPDPRHESEKIKNPSLCHHQTATSQESPSWNHSIKLLPKSWLTEKMKEINIIVVCI